MNTKLPAPKTWLTLKQAHDLTTIREATLVEMAENGEIENCFLRGKGERNFSWAFPPDLPEQLIARTRRIMRQHSPYNHGPKGRAAERPYQTN